MALQMSGDVAQDGYLAILEGLFLKVYVVNLMLLLVLCFSYLCGPHI